jgi:predicted ATP-grasp superfamily ATP-dependent carboligase
VIEAGLRFLRGVGLRGLFHVEFKRDPRDGQLKLLECNHRFTIEAMFSPVDLPLLAYNRVLGRPPPPARRYERGVHLWSPANDVRALRAYRRRGELTVRGWVRSVLRRQRFHAFTWSDPMPTIRFHLAWLARGLRRLGGESRGRAADPLLPPHR